MPYDDEVKAMRKRGLRPEVITTYSELHRVCDGFIEGNKGFKIPFLILIGGPGLAKSFQFENITGAYYINNAASAVGLYRAAYRHRNEPIILDDVDGLLQDKPAVSLLKALGSDRETKVVTWEKLTAALVKENIPTQFETTSRLCILCNEFPRVSRNVQAVLDRAKIVIFVPSVEEVHRYVGSFWRKQNRGHMDVYHYIGENLQRITSPSIRWYDDALLEKKLGYTWREWLLKQWHDGSLQAVVADIHSKGLPKGKAMEAEWSRRTGLSRPSWFRYQKEYLRAQGGGCGGARTEIVRLLDRSA